MDEKLPLKLWLMLAGISVMAWCALCVVNPQAWAAITVVLIVSATGLFTTKVLFRFEDPKRVWGLMPVFGLAWLLFFWLLFQLLAML